MKTMTFLQLAERVLEETKQPMTPEEVWSFASQHGYADQVRTTGRTPWRTIGAQIYVEIRDNPSTPFVKHASRPTRFSLKSLRRNIEFQDVVMDDVMNEVQPQENRYRERDLHPLMSYFAYTYWGVFTKTIYHEKSQKRVWAQWLHPDLVGVRFPMGELSPEVLDMGLVLGGQLVTLFSFEMKKDLNFTNLRESFFQAVSNSSWAHEGYLVAANVFDNEEFLNELKRLSSSFGIGVIKLNVESPDDSLVLYPAKPKNELDWDTIDKLSRGNSDFRDFLVRVRNDMNSKEIIREKYDRIESTDALAEKFATQVE